MFFLFIICLNIKYSNEFISPNWYVDGDDKFIFCECCCSYILHQNCIILKNLSIYTLNSLYCSFIRDLFDNKKLFYLNFTEWTSFFINILPKLFKIWILLVLLSNIIFLNNWSDIFLKFYYPFCYKSGNINLENDSIN